MQEFMAPILDDLANQLVSLVQEEWTAIVVVAQALPGEFELKCSYQSADTGSEKPFYGRMPVIEQLMNLRSAMIAETGLDWQRVRFELHPDGTFDIDFTYAEEEQK